MADHPRFLRTPEERFAALPGFPWAPSFVEIDGLRLAFIDEGPRAAKPVLLLHGEPSWSYLYRKVIPVLVAQGHRVIAPDLVGFGQSDKPAAASEYSYAQHVRWMTQWLDAIGLTGITLFCQDWGSLIGLRMVVERPDRFDRVAVGNGGLPTGSVPMPRAFKLWRAFALYSPWFPISRIVQSGTVSKLSRAELAAYEAPFPTSKHKVAARVFPGLVPVTPTDPERENNERAWAFFEQWKKPFLTLFSTRDPITRGGERRFQARVPGAKGQAHRQIHRAGHFLQEDQPLELASALDEFIRAGG